ncbi:MAG: hypothetical protein V3W18_08505 [candidate division Zixibacteria bacterium]
MNKIFTVLILITVFALLPVLAHAQVPDTYYEGIGTLVLNGTLEFNNSGGGARAAGMGGAFVGIADGELGYSWNPAGMMSVDKVKLGVQVASIGDNFASNIQDVSPLHSEPNIEPREIKREHFSLNFAGLVAPFEFMDRDWAVGGGYRNVFDMITEYSTPGFDGTRNEYSQDRGIDAISAAIAGNVITGVSAGLTINTYLRNSESSYYNGASNLYVSQDFIDTTIVDMFWNTNSHYSGVNFDLGLHGDFGMFSGGFVFHSPLKLKESVKATIEVIIPPVPFGIINRSTFTYDIPFSYSLGVAIRPIENLTIAADFNSRPLSEVELKKDYEQLAFQDTTVNPGWEDVNQFRIGAEYNYDAGFAEIPVRFGFRNEPSTGKQLLQDTYNDTTSTWASTFGDQITTNIISFGTGLYFEKIWFDFAYQFGSSSYNRTIDAGTPEIFEIKYDYSRILISSGMYF